MDPDHIPTVSGARHFSPCLPSLLSSTSTILITIISFSAWLSPSGSAYLSKPQILFNPALPSATGCPHAWETGGRGGGWEEEPTTCGQSP